MLVPCNKTGEMLLVDETVDPSYRVFAPVVAPTSNAAVPSEPTAPGVKIEPYYVSRPAMSGRQVELGGDIGRSHEGEQRVDGTEIKCGVEICDEIGPVAVKTMHFLLKAHSYAQQLELDAWDFAVEIDFLGRVGIGAFELRWLEGSGLLDHAEEITATGDQRRVFGRGGYLTFDENTCFVLTELGFSVACALKERQGFQPITSEMHTDSQADHQPVTLEKPQWDADRQKLYFGGELVKEFKLPSPNQTAILAAFEEEQWPAHVDDPLPMCPTIGPKERLRYTIKSLNRHQKKRFIRFRGDGRGEGICWEVCEHTTGL